ncbi:MAG TPA: ABC transporter permease [Thermoanaerobacterales bacterium]|nr:ABC transporter permease [Thermoanaerobacterales bacterium]
MIFRNMRYFIREALNSMGRNRWMSIASIGAVTAALIILGVFLIVNLNFNFIAEDVETQVEITAYLDDNLNGEDISKIGRELIQLHGVKEVVFVSRGQALKEFREQLGDRGDLLDALEKDNPLPNSYRIKAHDPHMVGEIADSVALLKGVDEVRYGKEIVEKLFKITEIIRIIGLVVMVVFSLISVFIISNTVKLTVYARRKEIQIMQQIGATDWFIRWPFLIEGIILGFLGSLISIVLLNIGYYYIYNSVLLNIPIIKLLPREMFLYDISLWFIGIGTCIGAIGSSVSMRRFLRV